MKQFLALGDSYTIGESVTNAERWPNQLITMFEPFDAGWETQMIAKTGWTTGELLDAIETTRPTGPFDFVSLLCGVNNQYRGLDEQEYADELETLLILAIEFAGSRSERVLVLSIPDWGVTPFAADRDRHAVSKAIDRFNERKRELTIRRNCHFVDITAISRQASEDPALLAADGLHPSAKMYRAWCELVFPIVQRVLGNETDPHPS